jgi:DNA polymerase V
MKYLNVLRGMVSAGMTGFESPAAEYSQEPLTLDEVLVESVSASLVCLVEGESMEGVGIFDGDMLIINRSLAPIAGDVVVANLNGEFVCKEIDVDNRVLISHKRGYDDYQVRDCDELIVLGVVTRSVRMHRPFRLERFKEGA